MWGSFIIVSEQHTVMITGAEQLVFSSMVSKWMSPYLITVTTIPAAIWSCMSGGEMTDLFTFLQLKTAFY